MTPALLAGTLDSGSASGPLCSVAVDLASRRVAVVGELDCCTARLLIEATDALLTGAAWDLTVDLGRLSFIDSSGVAALEEIDTALRARGHRLLVRHVPRRIARVLRLAGAQHLVPDADRLPVITAARA